MSHRAVKVPKEAAYSNYTVINNIKDESCGTGKPSLACLPNQK